ncbi:MAG: DUF835 domain-containing protein [Candidatus Methanofastidiosia archaeon]
MHRTDLFHRVSGWYFPVCVLLIVGMIFLFSWKQVVWVPVVLASFLRFKFPFADEDDPPDARCGAMCSLCISYRKGRCPSCAFGDDKLRTNCPIFQCASEKDTACTECPEVLHCSVYREFAQKCPFASKIEDDTIPGGNGFLIKESVPDESLNVLCDRIVRGDFGLIILRQSTDVLDEWPPLKGVPLVHLKQTVAGDNCLDPTNLAKMHLTIEEFFQAAPRATVLLEGMEYLITHNGVDRMLKFIHSVVECVRTYNTHFITIVDPRILEDNELVMLEQELVPLEPGKKWKF